MLVLTLFTAAQRFRKVWLQASASVPAAVPITARDRRRRSMRRSDRQERAARRRRRTHP